VNSESQDWLLGQLADIRVQNFVVQFLSQRPDLLKDWFPVLIPTRLFVSPKPIPGEGGVGHPWPAGRLLLAAAEQQIPGLPEVLEANKLVGQDGALYLLNAFQAVRDLSTMARLIPTALVWLAQVPEGVIDVPVMTSTLIELLRGGYQNEAAQLLDGLLGFREAPLSTLHRRKAQGRLSDFWVRHLLHELDSQAGAVHRFWLVHELEVKVREIEEWQVEGTAGIAPPAYVRSYDLYPVAEMDGPTADFGDILTAGLSRATLSLTDEQPSVAAELVDRWLADHVLLFRRLGLHVMAERGHQMPELRGRALRLENLTLSDCYSEFWQFLRSQFCYLPDADRKRFEEGLFFATQSESDTHLRYRWLSAIKGCLSPPSLAIFEQLDGQFGESAEGLDRLARMSEVRMLHPVSPVAVETLSVWTVPEIVLYCRHFVGPEESFDAPSKEGLSDALQAVVEADPTRFAAEAFEFRALADDNPANESPRFAQSLLVGLATAVREARLAEMRPDDAVALLLGLLSKAVFELISWIGTRVDQTDDQYIPGWEAARRAAADLLVTSLESAAGFARPEAALLLSDTEEGILASLAMLQRASDPTSARDHDDPLQTCLNSTRGKALFAAVAFLRCWNTALSGTDDEAPRFAIHPSVLDLFEERLKGDRSPGVRSFFGWRLPFLHAAAPEWTQSYLNRILPDGDDDDAIWQAAWDAYIAFNQLYTDLWSPLRDNYARAAQKPGLGTRPGHQSDTIDERLGSHLFLAWFEDFQSAEDILGTFIANATDQLRAAVARFGRAVLHDYVFQRGLGVDSWEWIKLRRFWAERLNQTGSFWQGSCGPLERAAYVTWLELAPEPLPALAPLVRQVSTAFAEGHDWDAADLLFYLVNRVEQYPVEATELISNLAESTWPRWLSGEQQSMVQDALRIARRDSRSRPHVLRLVETLVTRHQLFGYRSVLDD
jgi:hypothetical protein